jgi:hypothetical protein
MNSFIFGLMFCILMAAPLMNCDPIDIDDLKKNILSLFQSKLKKVTDSAEFKKMISDLLSNDLVKSLLQK